jgi:hypothetical protein
MQAVLGNHSFEGCAAVRLTVWSANKATQRTNATIKATSPRGGVTHTNGPLTRERRPGYRLLLLDAGGLMAPKLLPRRA